jgi:hypothetical protein
MLNVRAYVEMLQLDLRNGLSGEFFRLNISYNSLDAGWPVLRPLPIYDSTTPQHVVKRPYL